MTTAIPPIACSLSAEAVPDRAAWMREIGQDLQAIAADRARATLSFSAERREELEEFVRAESGCCSFFDFELTAEADVARLSITAPEDAHWAVRGLVAGFVAAWGDLV